MVTAVIHKVLIKSKIWLTGFQCRPQEEHFYLRLCYSPYKHKSYGIIQFFSMVGVLGSPSMPQELYHTEDHQLVKFAKKNFDPIISTLRLYHGLLRNKHNEILLELASG